VAIKKRVEVRSSEFAPVIARFRDATEAAATIVPEVREFNESLDLIATKAVTEIDGLLVELDRRIEAARAGKAVPEPQQLLTWCPESAQISDRVHGLPVRLTKEEAAEDRSSTATASTPRRKNPQPRLSHEV
jgi:hypothetical protein